MATGRVVWFDGEKGFGFVRQDSGGEDVFVHHTCVVVSALRRLKEGQAVSFEITQSQKGLRAMDVKVI